MAFSTAQTIPFFEPSADTEGVGPGYGKNVVELETEFVALDRSFHIHLPEEAAKGVTRRPNYGQSSYRLSGAIGRLRPAVCPEDRL